MGDPGVRSGDSASWPGSNARLRRVFGLGVDRVFSRPCYALSPWVRLAAPLAEVWQPLQQLSSQRPVAPRPFATTMRVCGILGAHALELRIQVVKVVHQKRFGKHRLLG